MSTVSHPPHAVTERRWSSQLLVAEMWASTAIVAMWVAVAVSAVWAPDFVSVSGSGTSSTTIPAAVAVAIFASVGTWAVAKYGFGRQGGRAE